MTATKERLAPTVVLTLNVTVRCLLGCATGDILWILAGALFLLTNIVMFVGSLITELLIATMLGIIPLLRSGYSPRQALKDILLGGGMSVVAMESAQAVIQGLVPGLMTATVYEPIFWTGVAISLVASFAVAYPVNLVLVKRGYRHRC
jgi:hypothetical protein